jgi:hypothetical protein
MYNVRPHMPHATIERKAFHEVTTTNSIQEMIICICGLLLYGTSPNYNECSTEDIVIASSDLSSNSHAHTNPSRTFLLSAKHFCTYYQQLSERVVCLEINDTNSNNANDAEDNNNTYIMRRPVVHNS